MNINELFMIAVIWTHAIAATTWLGGSIFYIFVFKPQQEKFLESGNPLLIALAEQFRSIIGTCIVVLIACGTLLLFDRITDPSTTPTYIAVLATKIVLATWMFTIARRRWRSSKNNDGNIVRGNVITKLYGMSTGINLTLILGILIFFLSDILNALFIQG